MNGPWRYLARFLEVLKKSHACLLPSFTQRRTQCIQCNSLEKNHIEHHSTWKITFIYKETYASWFQFFASTDLCMQEQRGLRKLIDAYLVQTATPGVGEYLKGRALCSSLTTHLVVATQIFVYFHQKIPGEINPIWLRIFLKWVGSTTSLTTQFLYNYLVKFYSVTNRVFGAPKWWQKVRETYVGEIL